MGQHGFNNDGGDGSGGGTYVCAHCSLEFTEESLYVDHMRVHEAELPFKCHLCDLRFELESNLSLHVEGHHQGRVFTCNFCKKSFKKKSYFLGHMQMHTAAGQQQQQ